MTAAIIQLQKKEEAKFICSACGADRGCNCNAPAVEKLAQKQEQDRQRSREYRARKAEENQQSRHVTKGSPGYDDLCTEAEALGAEPPSEPAPAENDDSPAASAEARKASYSDADQGGDQATTEPKSPAPPQRNTPCAPREPETLTEHWLRCPEELGELLDEAGEAVFETIAPNFGALLQRRARPVILIPRLRGMADDALAELFVAAFGAGRFEKIAQKVAELRAAKGRKSGTGKPGRPFKRAMSFKKTTDEAGNQSFAHPRGDRTKH